MNDARTPGPSDLTEALHDMLDYAVVLLDQDGLIRYWSNGAREIVGYDASEVLGRHVSLLFTPEDIRTGKPAFELKESTERGRSEDENFLVRKDGRSFFASGVTRPLRGSRSGHVKMFRDATGRKRIEDESRARADQLVSARTLKVLVIDDNMDAADSLSMLVRLYGHDVRLAHDGLRALELEAEFSPDVVLLDIGLPGVDGYEVARRIRGRHVDTRVVLVAMTGYGQQEDRRQAFEAGCDFHIVKPAEPTELQRLLAVLAPR